MSEAGPALTPEEWAGPQPHIRRLDLLIFEDPAPEGGDCVICEDHGPDAESGRAVILPEDRHALAALALHGQPFGFTWGHVDALREVIADATGANLGPLHDLADRIAALLPPRE